MESSGICKPTPFKSGVKLPFVVEVGLSSKSLFLFLAVKYPAMYLCAVIES